MRNVAELLERKRRLLDRRHEVGPEHLAEVEHELHEIDAALSQLDPQGCATDRATSPRPPLDQAGGSGNRHRFPAEAAELASTPGQAGIGKDVAVERNGRACVVKMKVAHIFPYGAGMKQDGIRIRRWRRRRRC